MGASLASSSRVGALWAIKLLHVATPAVSARMVFFALTLCTMALAVLYTIIGVPCAWALWYIRLYTAAIKDRAFGYLGFFIAYLIHIFWCIWSAICECCLNQFVCQHCTSKASSGACQAQVLSIESVHMS